MKFTGLALGITLLVNFSLYSQGGLKGCISSEDGELLPFATIYIEETNSGTASNQDGEYRLELDKGEYTLHFKYLGYQTIVKKVAVGTNIKVLNIELSKQTVLLNEVVTTAKSGDPANYIMQKVIARSAYHRQIVDSSSFEVYVKGKGKITEIPFLLENLLEKEGIGEGSIFTTESVSEIQYRRPNQYAETVKSVYASDDTDFAASPMPFIAGSFYDNNIANSVSPVGDKAFKYYKFKHLGAFTNDGHLINKIQVTPKVSGPSMFEGVLHIVEEDWSLYYLDLTTQIDLGVEVNLKQSYEKIDGKIWQPITYEFSLEGSPMGFGFEFKYYASVSDYTIELNSALEKMIKPVIDESEKQKATAINNFEADMSPVEEKMVEEIQAYEEEQRDSVRSQEIQQIRTYKEDSMAYSRDSSFWSRIRPIPLTEEEKLGYVQRDSVAEIQEEEEKRDSTKSVNRSIFQVWDILTGGNYSLSKDKSLKFKIYSPLLGINYNTVEGYNIDYSLGLQKNLPMKIDSSGKYINHEDIQAKRYFLLKPTLRYGFARENEWLGKVLLKYQGKDGFIRLEGGRYIRQFNDLPAVSPLLNTSFSLIWEQNFMKIYESSFASIDFEVPVHPNLQLEGDIRFEERSRLFNNSDNPIINWKRDFTPNLPRNIDLVDDFDGQRAFITHFRLSYKPRTKYYVSNGIKYPISEDEGRMQLGLSVFSGFSFFNTDVQFNRLELDYKDRFEFGEKGTTFFNVVGGGFLNKKQLGFMDYAHFPGNLSFVTQADPVKSYRLLEYYLYSTDEFYVQTFLYHQFRRLLITQLPVVRFMGIKENVFVNHLQTPTSNNYTEVGYSIDGIFNFFRFEIATSYEDFQFRDIGFRVGISTTLGGAITIDTGSD